MYRFYDEGKYVEEFQREIAVVCPTCSKQASVMADGSQWTAKNTKVVCEFCGFNESGSHCVWYGPTIGTVRCRCYHCGSWITRKYTNQKYTREINVSCSKCQCTMIEKVIWHRLHMGAYDPYFGLNLWFVGNVRGKTFWAYNREHLSFIQNYVSAKLRIREPNRNSSLVSKLPAWLLSSKNRLAVVKEITKMQRKTIEL